MLLTSVAKTHISPVVTHACYGPVQVLQRLVAGRPELVPYILLPVMDALMAAHRARLGLGPGPEPMPAQGEGQGVPGAGGAATTRPSGQGTEGIHGAPPGCTQEGDLGHQEEQHQQQDAEEQGVGQQQGKGAGPAAPSHPHPQPLSQPLRYDRHHMPVGWLLQGFGELSPGLGCLWQQQGAACAHVLAAAVRGRAGGAWEGAVLAWGPAWGEEPGEGVTVLI